MFHINEDMFAIVIIIIHKVGRSNFLIMIISRHHLFIFKQSLRHFNRDNEGYYRITNIGEVSLNTYSEFVNS